MFVFVCVMYLLCGKDRVFIVDISNGFGLTYYALAVKNDGFIQYFIVCGCVGVCLRVFDLMDILYIKWNEMNASNRVIVILSVWRKCDE